MAEEEKSKEEEKGKGLADKAFGPAAEEFGKELAPVGKDLGAVTAKVSRMLISGLSRTVYGLEQVGEWIKTEVSERLRGVPDDKIVEPNPRIAVPATQALLYSMDDKTIREMFANLLAADMNANTKDLTHPAFVEMIREMTAPDAKVLAALRQGRQIEFRARIRSGMHWQEIGYGFSFNVEGLEIEQIAKSLSNMKRLEIILTHYTQFPILPNLDELEKNFRERYEPALESYKKMPKELRVQLGLKEDELILDITKMGIYLTPMGTDFVRICLAKS